MRKKTEEFKHSRQLREAGWSIRSIAKELHVSRSSVSIWVRDITLTETQRQTLQFNRKDGYRKAGLAKIATHAHRRKEWREEGKLKAREGDPLHMQGCMLYWAEGHRTNNRNLVGFCNTDLEMLKLFIQFLRESLKIPDKKIIFNVSCHLNNGLTIPDIENYWLEKLNLPLTSLRKTRIIPDKPSTIKKRTHIYGICHIRIGDTHKLQHILGAIQEYGGFIRKEDEW